MAITKEAVEIITGFYPGKNIEQTTSRENVIGQVGSYQLVYDVFCFQGRAVDLPQQPLVLAWRRQPVLALVNGEQKITLAYKFNVERLGESLVEAVVKLITPELSLKDWPEED